MLCLPVDSAGGQVVQPAQTPRAVSGVVLLVCWNGVEVVWRMCAVGWAAFAALSVQLPDGVLYVLYPQCTPCSSSVLHGARSWLRN